MRASVFHLNTLKEAPAEAEIVSHQMMLRAGMIRKHAGGIYSYLPLGVRVLHKIESIVRAEMNQAGALEVLMPMVQPAELWEESGRWDHFGPELLRIKDRHQRDFLLQPTSEEVITDIARNEIHSWRQLPLNFYHIQTKFRDERRPRFGVMRSREFIMKDAYSFDRDRDAAAESYQRMYAAYCNIFNKLGLTFRAVAADTGAIGGDLSHEFQVIAETGEDLIVYSPEGEYAANIELAEAPSLTATRQAGTESLHKVHTPDAPKCDLVASQIGVPIEQTVKSVVYYLEPDPEDEADKGSICLALVRGDHEVNEVKLGKLEPFRHGYRLATEQEIIENFGSEPGYLGPVNPLKPISIVADLTVANMHDFVCGANEAPYHFRGVNWGRDLPEPVQADIRNVVAGDPSPDGKGTLAIQRGIEVGHIFFLGDKYSKSLNATFLNESGKPEALQMGCYGIGISRIIAAAIEQNHDDKGIIWPVAMAPFQVVICCIGWSKSNAVQQKAQEIYQQLLRKGVEVILDDRDARPGVMFSDWELVGVPIRITIGDRGLQNGKAEVRLRREADSYDIDIDHAAEHALTTLQLLQQGK